MNSSLQKEMVMEPVFFIGYDSLWDDVFIKEN